MKIALIALALLGLIVAALWLLGGREQTFRSEIRIDAPPERVFPWLVEPARLAQWIDGLVESRPLGDGRLRVGARSVDVIEENGRKTEMNTEVLALEPGRLLEVRIQSVFLEGTNRLALEPAGGSTKLVQTLTASYRGVTRLFGPFMGATVQGKLDADLARLREAVESSPGL